MLTIKKINVFSSVFTNGSYLKGHFEALSFVNEENKGELLLILDQKLLNIYVDVDKLVKQVTDNIEYYKSKGFVFSVAKNYYDILNSLEYQSLYFYAE